MENNTERVKIRLNRLTILAIREFKKLKFGDPELPVSDSYIVTEAYKMILPKVSKIQWAKVNKTPIPNVTDNTETSITSSLPTTFTLELDVLEGLRKIQSEMVKKTQSRVFFSYVIKVVLYSAILEIKGELDNQTID